MRLKGDAFDADTSKKGVVLRFRRSPECRLTFVHEVKLGLDSGIAFYAGQGLAQISHNCRVSIHRAKSALSFSSQRRRRMRSVPIKVDMPTRSKPETGLGDPEYEL